MSESAAKLVYSEVKRDRAVMRAGKYQVAPETFEMGFAGAFRNAGRIKRLCCTRFYEKYWRTGRGPNGGEP